MDSAVSPTPALDVRRFIDDRPVSVYQLRVAALCAAVVCVDGFDAQVMGYVAPALSRELHIARVTLGSVISSGTVGMMIGALVLGPIADRVGRKPVLVASVLLFGLGSLLTATADSITRLTVLRVLTGFGLGGAMPNAIALTSEWATGIGWALGVGRAGSILGPILGGLLLSYAGDVKRVFWAAVIPPLIAATAAVSARPGNRQDADV